MSCERYKKALIEAAASGDRPNSAAREHLSSCTDCREFFTREEALFTAIDTMLGQRSNPELPQSFLSQASERLSRVSPPISYRRPAYAFAVVLLVLTLAVAMQYRRGVRVSDTVKAVRSPEMASENPITPAVLNNRKMVPKMPVERNRSISHVVSAVCEPQVLVPADERQAFERFVADSQTNQSFMMAFLTGTKEPLLWDRNPPVQVQPLQVNRLEVTALDPQIESADDPGISQ